MVSAGVCLQGKGRLHFVQEKSKLMWITTWTIATEINGQLHPFCSANISYFSKMEHLRMQQNRPK